MKLRGVSSLFVGVLLALTVGCAPTLRVNGLQPARVNLGASRKITLVESQGQRSARERVITELLSQSRSWGYYQVTDRTAEGIQIRLHGNQVEVAGGTGPGQAPDEIGVRLDVLKWDTDQKSRTVDDKDKDGKVIGQHEERYYEGKVTISVTAFNAEGAALLSDADYTGRSEDPGERNALHGAVSRVVSKLLADITPASITMEIRLDDSDEGQKAIIKVAEQGNVAAALDQMKTYFAANPQNVSAEYNLAALLDATGAYDEALAHYTTAVTNTTKDYYLEMKAGCMKRLADRQALAK